MHTLIAWLLALFQVPGNTPVAGAFATGTTPATPFITSQVVGTLRNDFTGCVGMGFQVSSSFDLSVKDLSRWVVSGNSQTHTLRLLDGTGSVLIASASVATSGAPAGAYKAATITPVMLEGNSKYVLMSQETNGGDQWYNNDTTVTPSSVATMNGAVSTATTCPAAAAASGGNVSFGPVNFDYVSSASAVPHTLINSQNIGTLRNNFSGCVGFQFTVGASNITLTGIGRWVTSGNSGSHLLYVTDTSGAVKASVTVNTSGATPNQYLYGSVSNTTLTASTSYNVYSTEANAGDQWSDNDAVVGNTLAASMVGAAVGGSCPGSATVTNAGQHSYVPVNIQYQ